MNEAQATVFIEARLLPDVDPTVEAEQMTELLALARDVDADGNLPGSDDYTTTYSTVGCYRAIAEGYAMKYGRAVGRFGFTTDGQQFQRNQTLDHLEHQRKLYARKVQQTPSTLGDPA